MDRSCVLCKSWNPKVCKTCENVQKYFSQMETKRKNSFSSRKEFPGPGRVENSSIYGNYVIATRVIEEGEIIIEETPLTSSPYGPSDRLPYCLSCYKDISFSAKCSRCKWPVCDKLCEMNSIHSDNECEIFSSNKVKCTGVLDEYFSLEVLRCLLLKTKEPKKWESVLQFEHHTNARANASDKTVKMENSIMDFIFNRCNLGGEFETELVNQIIGVLSVNTFWAHQYTKKYATLLFDKTSLFAHDCDPNTTKEIIQLPSDQNNSHQIIIRAKRLIQPGEMITISYVNVDTPLIERRLDLKELFYFDCCCSRCLLEIVNLESNCSIEANNNNNKIVTKNSIDICDKEQDLLVQEIICDSITLPQTIQSEKVA